MLTVTEMLRKKGVVDKFVEFFGDGLANLPLADRATIANMAPEYGSTCGIFPIDAETLRYLELSGRTRERVRAGRAPTPGRRGCGATGARPRPRYTDELELDLARSSRAWPARAARRTACRCRSAKQVYQTQCAQGRRRAHARASPAATGVAARDARRASSVELKDGAVLIAAITSCTNTSNPSVMLAAGLLARKARARGLTSKPWVKTSLAPGSRVVTDYFAQGRRAGGPGGDRLRSGRLRMYHLHRRGHAGAARERHQPRRIEDMPAAGGVEAIRSHRRPPPGHGNAEPDDGAG